MIKISAIAPYVLAVTINALGISLSHATTNTPPPTSFSYDSLYDLLYAEIALYRGQVATALQKYSQYAPILNNEQVLERAVQIANFLQNSKQAFSLSQQWANAYPTQSKAFYQLAYNALKTQHYAQAMTAIDKLLALDPETDLEILFLSAYPNDPEQRTQLLNALSELEKSHPNNAHLLFAHALLIGENGNTSQALLFAEKAKKINPNSIPATLLQARLLQLNKQKTLALQTLAHALKTYPDSPQLNMHYIRALINNKNYTEAENNLAQFLLKNPLNTEALLMHALLSYDNQHNRSAIDSFNKLIELNSNANEAYYYLAMIAKRQHNLAQAEKAT
jgi:tetratricopeptide (TPR) repeat protein